MVMKQIKKWLIASRPHTMGLSFGVILAGSGLVGWSGLHLPVLLLALLAAGGFQLVSNFANDYGDFQRGTDSHRQENYRSLSGGNFTTAQIKNAITILAITSLLATVVLVYLAAVPVAGKLTMLGLGIVSVIAAITYTLGKHPYGYYALGDIMVFIFFGLVGVVGSYYLQGGELSHPPVWLLACTFGCLSTSVLNINNMRDSDSDRHNGKVTVANVLGKYATVYQNTLLLLAVACLAIYSVFFNIYAVLPTGLLSAATYLLARRLRQANKHEEFNRCLAMTVKITLAVGGLTFVCCLSATIQ